ncbi:MAG: cytochrome c [Anditalea sp.]
MVFIGLLAEACSSRRSEPLWRSLESSNPQVKNGQVLYMEHCQKCHPLGEAGLAPAINSNPAPGFLKRFQVRHGLGAMPSFKVDEISRKELMDLSEYMKAMKHKKK